MTEEFPELTSFGTLLGFAQALEAAAETRASQAATRESADAVQAALRACARRHAKRGRQLERLRRERLNEVVLQPITGMRREDYVPPALPRETLPDVRAVARFEEQIARVFDDAAELAADVLGGLERSFRRLAAESRDLAGELQSSAS